MLQVRVAALEDADLLAELNRDVQGLHTEALPHIYKTVTDLGPVADDFRSRILTGADWRTFIVNLDGQPAGYACVVRVQRPEHAYAYAQTYLYLDQISVKPAYQGQGCGRALMEAVCDYARAIGMSRVLLDTMAFNEDAVTFYTRQGFQMYKHTMEMNLSAQNVTEKV